MKREEQTVHRTIVQHLRARAMPGCVWFHPPSGGWRSPVEAAIFKSLGVRVGVADLILLHDGQFFALELKAPGGRLTESQAAFLDDVEAVQAREAQVQHEDLWPKVLNNRNHRQPVADLTNDDVAGRLQNPTEAGPDEGLVVRDYDTSHSRRHLIPALT